MEHRNPFPQIAAMMALTLLMLASLSTDAFSAGTAAGVSITNQATVSYNAGANARTAQSGVVTLYVAHRVNGNFTPASAASSGVDNATYLIPFTFTNSGNRADVFSIAAIGKAGYTVSVVDGGGLPLAATPSLAPDASVSMQLKIVVAAGRADGDTTQATVILTSTAANAANIIVANPSAQFTYVNTFTVKKPVITFTAAQSAVVSNASRIPGANITYTMTLQNSGTGDVTAAGATITSVLSPNVVFVSAPAGTGYSAGVVSGQTAGRGGTVTWSVTQAAMAHGAAAMSPVLTVKVDQTQNNATGVVAGTQIYAMTTAQATQTKLVFNDGTNAVSLDNANSFNFAAGTASGAAWTVTPANGSGNPGDVVEYAFTLTNTGNHLDNYTFTNVQNGGNHDVNHLFATTSLGTAVTSLPATIAGGATQVVYVRVTVPLAATDAQTIARNIIAATLTGGDAPTGGTSSASYTAPLVTTVKAPLLAVTLSNVKVSGIGTVTNPAPGDVIQWIVKIANTGTGNASTVSASNAGYAHTVTNTVNAASVDIDPLGANTWPTTGLGNGGTFSGTPNGTVTITGGGIVTVTFNQIAAGQSAQYRYTVTVQ